MPLVETCSIDAFRENIRTEIRAGKSPEQATAIARRVLEDSCKREGQPVPKALAKAKPYKESKRFSREYLEAALSQAKKMLPGWMFAVLHQAAFPSSGGRAKRNRRLSATEKVWIEKKGIGQLTNQELKSMLHKLNVTLAAYRRQGKNTDAVIARAKSVNAELRKRGIAPKGSAGKVKKADEFLNIEQHVKKGFNNGEPEGGMHAHGLDRRNGKTMQDGEHIHLFVLPGSGDVLITQEDGGHAHALDADGNVTANDGPHSHLVGLPDGRLLETKLGGEHVHQLMVETSGFDGLHRHELRMPDATLVQSLSPGEFVARFADIEHLSTSPIHSAREIANAVNEARDLRDQIFPEGPPDIAEAVEDFAKSGKLPDIPNTLWEVEALAKGGAWVALEDMDDPVLVPNPHDLHLDSGDIVEIGAAGTIEKYAESAAPHSFEEAEALSAYRDEIEKATRGVPFCGPQNASVVFVSGSPSLMELARKEALIGADGELFQEQYLTPLGLLKKDVAIGFAIPVHCPMPEAKDTMLWQEALLKQLKVYNSAKIISMGRVAKAMLGAVAHYTLPHPAALRRHGDRGEVTRKTKSIRKALDKKVKGAETESRSIDKPIQGSSGTTLADSISELSKGNGLRVSVIKNQPEKQIVYGVILDPYQVDLHNDWIPPAEIEATAHDFLTKSRVIGLRHSGRAEAQVVESWVEVYPSPEDRKQALQNEPHKVFKRPFGNDVLHSGAWVAGVQLSDELWELHKRGELDAFSIGGFSFKTPVSVEAMPKVDFVDLQPAQ
jgi:uracil-DNA glycosylase